METSLLLIIHNILSIMSALIFIGIAFFTFLNNPQKTANKVMALTMLTGSIFLISHIIGVNIIDPNLSRIILTFNLVIFLSGPLNIHAIFALTGREKENKGMIIFLYLSALTFISIFIIYPNLSLLPSVPKMYFPNYYNPGPLNWTRIAFLYGVCVPYIIYLLISAFLKAKTKIERNQYKYFVISIIVVYIIIFIPNFLVYNIKIDPLWGMISGLIFAIPFVYGAVQYELFNIKVIAKQAFWYSIAVVAIGGLITLLNYSNQWINEVIPGFPVWVVALVSSGLTVTMSIFIWRRLRENDILRSEFITTVTHKFRTPLTQIKWASENISKAKALKDIPEQIGYIQDAETKLVDLTNLLVQSSSTENSEYKYQQEKTDIITLTHEIIASFASQINRKNLKIIDNMQPDIYASADASHLKFVIQILIENAIAYTPNDGVISLSISATDKNIIFSIKDSGIGITENEKKHLFSKFYRGDRARLADTEGMGIGLFISKTIISHSGGKIWIETQGENKGSTFSFSLPIQKNLTLVKESVKN